MSLCRLPLSRFLPLLALFFLSALPGHALRPDILYTPQSGFLQIAPARQLTLNAHVSAFQYEPLGLEIAFVGSETQGDSTMHFVKVVDVRTGHEMERLSFSLPTEQDLVTSYDYRILGWSPSGRSLMLDRYLPPADLPDGADPNRGECVRWDVSATPPSIQVVAPTAPLPEGASIIFTTRYLSPTGRWLAFKQTYESNNPDQNTAKSAYRITLYDVEKRTEKILPLPPGLYFFGWSDATHLKMTLRQGDDRVPKVYDVTTGTLQDGGGNPAAIPIQSASHQYPEMTLDTEARTLEDKGGSGGRIDSHILWIRRTPLWKKPLGVVSAGLTPGGEDPQAVWSPTGKQIAFIAHGDLCVTDLVATPASEPHPQETLAMGLKLTRIEEQTLALSDLKQIGLGLIQYCQDHDENYPPAAGIDEAILPYLKTRDVFSVGDVHWVYHAPDNLSLAAMEAPAETVIGTMDLGDTQITLFGDGHVKLLPKR